MSTVVMAGTGLLPELARIVASYDKRYSEQHDKEWHFPDGTTVELYLHVWWDATCIDVSLQSTHKTKMAMARIQRPLGISDHLPQYQGFRYLVAE